MKSSPRKLPARQTLKQLIELQKLTASVIMQPLAPGFRSSSTFIDGRPNSEVAAEFIKPNDRLKPFERLAIYNKQYWFRLIDVLYDDYPGLKTILGRLKFNRLITAYLQQYPSDSYTLRNLGDRLGKFIAEHPQLTEPRTDLCSEMFAFEWAQIVAFDGPVNPPLSIDDLLGSDPKKLRLGVQPYISLLHLHWPLDDFAIALKRSELRGEASNAVDAPSQAKQSKNTQLPARQEIFVAVHRLNNDLYYKRLEPNAYALLISLRNGKTLAAAVATTIRQSGVDSAWTANIQSWFNDWTQLGWFCKHR